MKFEGLSLSQVTENRNKYGTNALTQIPPDPLWKKIIEGFKDPMIIILCVALVIQVILTFMGKAEWYEPVGILIAIMIANGVSAVSESKQEGKASALKEEEEAKEMAKVIREGKLQEIHVKDVVVGDIIYLQAGDKIAADGEIVDGLIKVDQASLNGETEEATKQCIAYNESYNPKDLLNPCYIYRGTVVCSGEAYMQVKVVGDNTLFGNLALEVQENTRETPLQVKLGKLAKQISTFGYIGAAAIVAMVFTRTILTGNSPSDFYGWLNLTIEAVTVAVTIIVCAVPEGLPMLTSILLSYQSMRMAKDNVLVHKINGLETAGSLSILFSDKTGTITEGKLSVVEVMTGAFDKFSSFEEISNTAIADDILIGIGVNNSSSCSNGNIIGGNSTDRALMSFVQNANDKIQTLKEKIQLFEAFDSAKKYSSVLVVEGNDFVTYIKGAPEKILDKCSFYLDSKGEKKTFPNREALNKYMDQQANRSMRLLAVAKNEGQSENHMTLVCVLAIRDNVRAEAVDAIREVQDAGIQVVMVTGDRKETAVAIAKESGLLRCITDVALTSAELAELSDDALKCMLPNLRVVSRALPTDKSRLVRCAQELGMVVGMTGDGVNDSPALKKADVGFAMGSGTEVAKEAGDITILDDNFLSIEKAILYGRTMFKSIRKFLIFQLTVNVAAVLTCLLAPMFGENEILTVIQLLLINLVMDTLAAIAFGSEPALREYMKEKPIPRDASIVSKDMFGEIIISAIYITTACLCIRFMPACQNLLGGINNNIVNSTLLNSAVFATFMMAITFNGFNARTEHINAFEHIGRNRNFLLVISAILVLQFVFITFGGAVLHVQAMSSSNWIVCFIVALMIIPIDMIRKAITKAIKWRTK